MRFRFHGRVSESQSALQAACRDVRRAAGCSRGGQATQPPRPRVVSRRRPPFTKVARMRFRITIVRPEFGSTALSRRARRTPPSPALSRDTCRRGCWGLRRGALCGIAITPPSTWRSRTARWRSRACCWMRVDVGTVVEQPACRRQILPAHGEVQGDGIASVGGDS